MHPPFLRRHRAATIFISCCSLFWGFKYSVSQTPWHHQERLIGLISQDAGHIAVNSVGTEPFTSNARHSSDSRRAERRGLSPSGLSVCGPEVLPSRLEFRGTGWSIWAPPRKLGPQNRSLGSTRLNVASLDNSASLVAGTQGLPAVHCRATFRASTWRRRSRHSSRQWTMPCGAVGTTPSLEDISATDGSHCALIALTVAWLLSGWRGSRAVQHHHTIQTPLPPSLDAWTDTCDGASLSTGRHAEPSRGRPTFFIIPVLPLRWGR